MMNESVYTQPPLDHRLLWSDPERARRIIIGVLKEAKCRMSATAERLGVAHVTMLRWMKKLEMHEEVQALVAQAKAEGWLDRVYTGRPRLSPEEKAKRKSERDKLAIKSSSIAARAARAKSKAKKSKVRRAPSKKRARARS